MNNYTFADDRLLHAENMYKIDQEFFGYYQQREDRVAHHKEPWELGDGFTFASTQLDLYKSTNKLAAAREPVIDAIRELVLAGQPYEHVG